MSAQDTERCPRCGGELEYDEVDIGVGVQRGNYGCPDCHWVPRPAPESWTEKAIADAAEAVGSIPEDELEAHAEKLRREKGGGGEQDA